MYFDIIPVVHALQWIADGPDDLALGLAPLSDAGWTPPMTVDQPTPEDSIDGLATAAMPSVPTEQEEVRDTLAFLSMAGYSETVKTVLSHYGATMLSEVDSRFYRDLLAEVKALTLPTNSTTANETT